MAEDRRASGIIREEFEVPDVRHLARIYRESMGGSDKGLANAAEAAMMKFADAEAALAEAVAMVRFVDEASA